MSLRRRLTLGIALTAAVLGVALAGLVGSPAAAPPAQANGNAVGNLGLVGIDHVGITVPDIDEAIAWFEDVMGCSAPLTFGPFSDPTGPFMERPARRPPARRDRADHDDPLRPQRQHRALPVLRRPTS